ncbi:hypothetical protein ACKWTF_007226 [Chironomus riparius]
MLFKIQFFMIQNVEFFGFLEPTQKNVNKICYSKTSKISPSASCYVQFRTKLSIYILDINLEMVWELFDLSLKQVRAEQKMIKNCILLGRLLNLVDYRMHKIV